MNALPLVGFFLLIFLIGNSSAQFCSGLQNCSLCVDTPGCFWCADGPQHACFNISAAAADTACKFWTGGSKSDCGCSLGFWPCSSEVTGLIVLMLFYGLVLAGGAKTISDGSELLLEILDPGIIGGLVLPVLGALPDSAIILISGVTGSQAEAQLQLGVGVGTLAGSTIMLLTIPWTLCLWLARCDIRNGVAIDKTLTKTTLTRTGITVESDTLLNSKIMIATSLCYFIVQGVAFGYVKNVDAHGAKLEQDFALAGFIVCFLVLCCYFVYQVYYPKYQEKRMKEAKSQAAMEKAVRVFMEALQRQREKNSNANLFGSPKQEMTVNSDPKPETATPPSDPDIKNIGLRWKKFAKANAAAAQEEPKTEEVIQVEPVKEKDEEEEEEEKSDDPKWKIALKAIVILVIGTAIVSVFSDPMVTVITDLGVALNIPNFYLSFVVTPFCSNASEMISSLIFAMKKTRKNTSMTYSQLYGAAIMNNTMCLGIFFALVAFRKLTWTFTAETLVILLVILVVGAISAFQETITLLYGLIVLPLYPLSILFVYLLENVAHIQ